VDHLSSSNLNKLGIPDQINQILRLKMKKKIQKMIQKMILANLEQSRYDTDQDQPYLTSPYSSC
jgi:hypothetical protein